MVEAKHRKPIWRPISDLPTDWISLRSKELESLAPIWGEQSKRLQAIQVLKKFNERLAREWAIETGIIEGLYSIDRGTTLLLIEHGWVASYMAHGTIDRPANQLINILNDHQDALEGLFDFVNRSRDLSTSYIKELHALFTRHQTTTEAVDQFGVTRKVELIRGDWKRLPNNPSRPNGTVFEYCPPEQVDSEMDRLVEMHLTHGNVPAEIEAAWLHHRFTQIHPFQDGNGRVARALASLVFIRAGWFPLVIDRDQREKYIRALEASDVNDLSPLVDLFASIQKKSFLQALSLSDEILRMEQPVEAVIAAAVERLKARFEGKLAEQRRVFDVGDKIMRIAEERFRYLAEELNQELKTVDQNYGAEVLQSDESRSYWYNRDIIEIAKQLGYFADARTYAKWCRLAIYEARGIHIIISMHSIGREFVGILGASAFIKVRDKGEEGVVVDEGPYALTGEVLQLTFNEDEDVTRQRFEVWLRDVALAGIEMWRRGI
jgi:Fic family protein